jgi:hypothetical protein
MITTKIVAISFAFLTAAFIHAGCIGAESGQGATEPIAEVESTAEVTAALTTSNVVETPRELQLDVTPTDDTQAAGLACPARFHFCQCPPPNAACSGCAPQGMACDGFCRC